MKALLATLFTLALIACRNPKSEVLYYVNCASCRVAYSVNDSLRTEQVKNGFILTWQPLHEQVYGIEVDSVDSSAPAQLAVSQNGWRVYTQQCDSGATCVLRYAGEFTYK